MVRAQGGTPTAVALGRWSIGFYRRQADELGVDSGFREVGYLIVALDEDEAASGRERVEMQRALGLPVRWLEPAEVAAVTPLVAPETVTGASYLASDGYIDPPRNVMAYRLAMQAAGVELREGVRLTGLRVEGGRVRGVETTAGPIETDRALLAAGVSQTAVAGLAGVRVAAGGARHHVAVTSPAPAFAAGDVVMGFAVGAGLYWRPEEGGLLFGISGSDEVPGEATAIDWALLEHAREQLAALVPAADGLGLRKAWAATIDFTPDHHPVIGVGRRPDGEVVEGLVVASAGGHGMMWGPAVSRAAADLVLTGQTGVVDISSLGVERFTADGGSTLAPDSIALPFPERAVVTELR
jgi:sarcosine oxidase subunit beta